MADLLAPQDRDDERHDPLADDPRLQPGDAGKELVPTWAMSLMGLLFGAGMSYGFAVWRGLDVQWALIVGGVFGAGVGWLMAKQQ